MGTSGRVDPHVAGWLQLAASAPVVRRSAIVALVVGTILVAINHGDAIIRGDVTLGRVLRILLTVIVPYCVSTYSSVSALRAHQRDVARAAVDAQERMQ